MPIITTRKFENKDLEACLNIEAGAMSANRYLCDVVDFFRQTQGELTLGLIDGKPAGIGKLTVLFDGSVWLELLRVHPNFQRMGVAAAIYVRYMQQFRELKSPAMRMYTGVSNVASAALAEKNGMHRACEFRGMSLDVSCAPEREYKNMQLAPNADKMQEIAEPHRKSTGGYLNINHTFYAMNAATYGGFSANGWGYFSKNATLIAGARFQPAKALYIAAIGGNRQEAIDFAIMRAKAQGIEKITAHFAPDDAEMQRFYAQNGFVLDKSDDVVMENIL